MPLRLSNTRYNFSNINNINNMNINRRGNRPLPRANQRSFSTHQVNNNSNNFRTLNNNSNNGMFSILIANVHYNRYSAFNHRSNFGYRDEDSNIHNFDDLNDIFDHEIENDLEFMSRRNNNNLSRSIRLVGSLIIKPEKPKIQLEKIKMNKSLNTKNDGEKNEAPSCCICLAPMKINQDVTLLKCQHLYHFKCLDKWVEKKEACPFCRGKIEFAKIKKKKKDKKEDLKKIVMLI